MGKISYERRAYESVDAGSPSWVTSQKSTKKNSFSKGLNLSIRVVIHIQHIVICFIYPLYSHIETQLLVKWIVLYYYNNSHCKKPNEYIGPLMLWKLHYCFPYYWLIWISQWIYLYTTVSAISQKYTINS